MNKNTIERKLFASTEKKLVESSNNPIWIFLEWWHFDPRDWATEFAIQSLKESVSLWERLIKEYKNKIKIIFWILVDDLWLDCWTSWECNINQSRKSFDPSKLPSDLEDILKSSKYVKRDRVAIMWEITAKNRWIKTLKTILSWEIEYNNELISTKEEWEIRKIFFSSDDWPKVLIWEKRTESTRVAKCPTIMWQHYTDIFNLLQKRFPEIWEKIIVDFSDSRDINKVTKGSELWLRLFHAQWNPQDEIFNVFYYTPSWEHLKIHHFIKNEFD